MKLTKQQLEVLKEAAKYKLFVSESLSKETRIELKESINATNRILKKLERKI